MTPLPTAQRALILDLLEQERREIRDEHAEVNRLTVVGAEPGGRAFQLRQIERRLLTCSRAIANIKAGAYLPA